MSIKSKINVTSDSSEPSRRKINCPRAILVILCLVVFAAGIAALPNTMRRASAQNPQDKSKNLPTLPTITAPSGTDDKEEGDADLPPRFRDRIDKHTYLSLRDQY